MERENITMNDKPEIEIKIFGGTNMIVPTGTTAVQNFYGDQFAEVAIRPEATTGIESLRDDECHLFTIMLSEPHVDKDTVVKGTFIEVLLPFASRLTSGAKVDNVRQQINNMLMTRGRERK